MPGADRPQPPPPTRDGRIVVRRVVVDAKAFKSLNVGDTPQLGTSPTKIIRPKIVGLIIYRLPLRGVPPTAVCAEAVRVVAPPRHDGDASGPILRVPGAWLKPRRPPARRVLPAALGVILAPRRAARLGPKEAARPPGGHPLRMRPAYAGEVIMAAAAAIPEWATAGIIPPARHQERGPALRRPKARILGVITLPVMALPIGPPAATPAILAVITTTVLAVAAVRPAALGAPVPTAALPAIAPPVGARRQAPPPARREVTRLST